jgi:hypothetical protein
MSVDDPAHYLATVIFDTLQSLNLEIGEQNEKDLAAHLIVALPGLDGRVTLGLSHPDHLSDPIQPPGYSAVSPGSVHQHIGRPPIRTSRNKRKNLQRTPEVGYGRVVQV